MPAAADSGSGAGIQNAGTVSVFGSRGGTLSSLAYAADDLARAVEDLDRDAPPAASAFR